MNDDLKTLMGELEAFGRSNDAVTEERSLRMLNITRDTGEFLRVLVLATRAKNILEIGTSNGYSTLWLASAVSAAGGQVTTVEMSPSKFAMARSNFARSGLIRHINQVNTDGARFLREAPDAAYDIVFLDSQRSEYVNWKADVKRVMRVGGLLVVDNAESHKEQMADFRHALQQDPDFAVSLVQVGKGELLACRQQ